MTVASVLRNRIPQIIKDRGLSISDLQRITGLSYPGTHNLASDNADIISDETRVGTLRKIAEALGVSLNDLAQVEIVE